MAIQSARPRSIPFVTRSVGIALAVLFVGCAGPSPLPWNVEVRPPLPDIRPTMAAFSGWWDGSWEPSGVRVTIVVEQILPAEARIVVSVGSARDGVWRRLVMTTPRDQDPVEFRADFTDPDGTEVKLKLWMGPAPETLVAEMEVGRPRPNDWGPPKFLRARLRRFSAARHEQGSRAAPDSAIRCPVPVHHFLPAPADMLEPVGTPDQETAEQRAFVTRMYERSQTHVQGHDLGHGFPDDPNFKRAYLLMWKDWASRHGVAPAIAPRDREWFWRWRCAPGTVETLRAKHPSLFGGAP
jgi:hypothetical protein